MYNHNKAQQSKTRVHISWDMLYLLIKTTMVVAATWGINFLYEIENKHLCA